MAASAGCAVEGERAIAEGDGELIADDPGIGLSAMTAEIGDELAIAVDGPVPALSIGAEDRDREGAAAAEDDGDRTVAPRPLDGLRQRPLVATFSRWGNPVLRWPSVRLPYVLASSADCGNGPLSSFIAHLPSYATTVARGQARCQQVRSH